MNSSSWVSRLFGAQPYEPLNQSSTQNLPGHFPGDPHESVGPAPRGAFNSESVSTATSTVLHWVNYLLIKPVTVLVVVLLSLLARFLQVLYFNDVENQRCRSSSQTATTSNNVLMNDPISKVDNFVRELEENLLPEQQFSLHHSDSNVRHLPPFFQGSYTQALYMATYRAKFLFVYLTNSDNEASQTIFNRVVTNQKFISIFTNSDSQNIIWGGDLKNLEAYQLANSLNVTKFPFLGLLCLTRTSTMTPRGPSKTPPKISLILKIQGGMSDSQDADAVIFSKFNKRMHKYEPELALIRADLREKYMSEVMRRQQDLDYQKSLLKDKQKKQEKMTKQLASEYLKWRQPYFVGLREDQDRTNKAKIAIKMVDGTRATFYLPKESPVEDIFTFVELHNSGMLEASAPSTLSDTEANKRFGGFDMPYKFKLLSPMPPRQLLNDLERTTKIQDVNYIYPSGLLMVESV